MTKNHFVVIALALFVAVSFRQAQAFEPYADNLSIGLSWGNYEYKEDLPAPLKSEEDGDLFGFRADYSLKEANSFYFGANAEWLEGDTDYDGSFQDGTPHQGKTKNSMLRFEFLAGWTILPLDYFLVTPFVGFGQLQWERRLGGEYPYDEDYRWRYIPVGVHLTYDLTNRLNIGFTGQVNFVFDSEIKLDALDFSGKEEIGKKSFYTMEAPITFQFSEHWLASCTPFFTLRPSDDSGWFYLNPETIAMEPESRSTLKGLRLQVKATF